VSTRSVRQATIAIAATGALLAIVSGLVWFLEDRVGVPDASSVFLLAVVVAASRFGTGMAVVAAVGASLVYDLFFIEPRFTIRVADPGEWLNLIVLLVVGIVVGRLAAAQRDRAEAAVAREREATSLFRVGRVLATRPSTAAVLPELAAILRVETAMDRIRITLATSAGLERTAVDTTTTPTKAIGESEATGVPRATGGDGWTPPALHRALRRTPGAEPAEWVRVHHQIPAGAARAADARVAAGAASSAGGGGSQAGTGRSQSVGRGESEAFRVVIEVGDRRMGSIWAVRPRHDGPPDAAQTRLLSAAADQIGQALEQDRLGREAREMEIARRGDALKTALLESVSHDLRTPLTSIRAAAGTLLDREIPLGPGAQEAAAEAIDREAEHLNRLVTNLLDLSRIEAGELRVDPEPFELAPLVDRAVDRLRPRIGARVVVLDVPDDLPPVLVDEVFIDQILTNLLENTIKYTGPTARIRVHAVGSPEGVVRPADPRPHTRASRETDHAEVGPDARPGGTIRLTVEDDGPGVPDDTIDRLFDRFFRVPRRGEPSRPGSGIGLTVVRGLVEAMGGRVVAARSPLGGLGISLILPSVAPLAADGAVG
jgi:two-component system sensor histidine kinase KdpD